jgi:HAD superfamily hydrolase (TIGR01509 family)
MPHAFIFDFDGVLVDTMATHFDSYRKALEEFGVAIDRDQFYRQAGMTGREQIRYFAERAGVKLDVEAVYQRKRDIQPALAGKAQPITCNLELLRLLRAAGWSVGIASGSSRESVLSTMGALGIEADIADVIVTADDVTQGKPHPDLFLLSAERLGVSPERCLVVEDSVVGVQAAQAAGMKVFHFLNNGNSHPPSPDAGNGFGLSNMER